MSCHNFPLSLETFYKSMPKFFWNKKGIVHFFATAKGKIGTNFEQDLKLHSFSNVLWRLAKQNDEMVKHCYLKFKTPHTHNAIDICIRRCGDWQRQEIRQLLRVGRQRNGKNSIESAKYTMLFFILFILWCYCGRRKTSNIACALVQLEN